ncbi:MULTISPECIES: AAA family ATPase [Klebsiella]|uniref:5-methylcytosine-specific restriction enzyme B n=1 Tax=Klebsiella pasteurii TaxID=2587529 RepID=A0A9Q9S9W0_9ENTR|nr:MULTISPECIES: AAA family ATPase [Klebsiella]ELG9969575.1 AAA family ATPase [Klebsiella michiganensis]MBZ7228119.1 ATPase [Klebsiella michiganensis]SBL08515.1 5-methylcytosine-specific restriction enzyme with GTPase activity [Klebsiella michiganensis]SBM14406.1 5-methylcytosine-specific restriction enzyme with GTPase activity [Klebsiella michiganensis]VUS84920.1 5-methylcytosine-specific restriction enzyme B [Klebsiella pasteurii]
MLNSLEIYQALNELGYRLEAGKFEPSYASEHALGNGKYLYVKRKQDGVVSKSPLVLAPETLALRAEIDRIAGIHCLWEKVKSTSYRRYPKDNGTSQYGFAADVESPEALQKLMTLLCGARSSAAFSDMKQDNENKELPIMSPLNQILFGPPGTGKTYATTEMAVKIADNSWYQQATLEHHGSDLREQVKERYQMLVEKQRIMFTTFHQSFSYEDFIEGIRATTDESTGTLRYEVVDGIFKQLCLNARVKVQGSATQPISLEGRRIWKMSLGNTMGGEEDVYEDCLANNYVLLGWGEDIDFSNCSTYESVKARIASEKQSSEDTSNYMGVAVNTFKNIIKVGDVVIVSDGNHKFRAIAEITGEYSYLPNDEREYYHQMRSVKWLRTYTPSLPKEQIFTKSLSQMTLYELQDTTIDREKLTQLLAPVDDTDSQDLPHVLIIDEINRGNIARILGELITLLEPDKRQGADDERSLMLPYSKQTFSVPKNVFIIGTMNTADKSLIQMDLALRRRFSFTEMPARPDLLAGISAFGIDVAQLLTRINQRIEALLDSEHMIGHAYFMPLKNIENNVDREACLASIFQEKIIPLLREYFFDDYERIGWVLNDSVKAKEYRFILLQQSAQLPSFSDLFPKEIAESLSDRRFRINERAFLSAEAYQGIVA